MNCQSLNLKNKGKVMKTIEEHLEPYPRVRVEDKYLLILNEGTIAEDLYNYYDTELEAYKVGKSLNDKFNIRKGNVSLIMLDSLPLIEDYEFQE